MNYEILEKLFNNNNQKGGYKGSKKNTKKNSKKNSKKQRGGNYKWTTLWTINRDLQS